MLTKIYLFRSENFGVVFKLAVPRVFSYLRWLADGLAQPCHCRAREICFDIDTQGFYREPYHEPHESPSAQRNSG